MDPEPQELRLMTTRGATLSTLSYGYAYSSELTCSSWEPVPPGFLLAGLMWQEVDYWLSSYTGFSARVGFIYAGARVALVAGKAVLGTEPRAARSYSSYSDDGGGGGGSSVGMIVGIGVGVAAALIITAALISISRRRSRRQQQQWHNAGPYPPAVGVERPMAPEILLAK
ncbi:hypothetical protein HYH03_003568 [Edaphochlamys debaryana]|uniref:Uncharacterized protein n=1 Tax=Edaphochlamys debaryana TaxID=47281 RepID=A0A835YB98_9CHLO|nr:hypothetical protein HYH03_003568 [Edaphochlamys debaryana]|eukprot:KAG2498307.1 hypothetical protein HYH03_003568 [Edaphochlamys debaryana]